MHSGIEALDKARELHVIAEHHGGESHRQLRSQGLLLRCKLIEKGQVRAGADPAEPLGSGGPQVVVLVPDVADEQLALPVVGDLGQGEQRLDPNPSLVGLVNDAHQARHGVGRAQLAHSLDHRHLKNGVEITQEEHNFRPRRHLLQFLDRKDAFEDHRCVARADSFDQRIKLVTAANDADSPSRVGPGEVAAPLADDLADRLDHLGAHSDVGRDGLRAGLGKPRPEGRREGRHRRHRTGIGIPGQIEVDKAVDCH